MKMGWTQEDEDKAQRFNEWMKKEIEGGGLVNLRALEGRPKKWKEKKWKKHIKRLEKGGRP